MKKSYLACLSLIIIIAGCSSYLPQSAAEQTAEAFIKERGNFFSTNASAQLDVQDYELSVTRAERNDDYWFLVYHITASFGNDTKKGDVALKVSHENKVIEFNGQKVIDSG